LIVVGSAELTPLIAAARRACAAAAAASGLRDQRHEQDLHADCDAAVREIEAGHQLLSMKSVT